MRTSILVSIERHTFESNGKLVFLCCSAAMSFAFPMESDGRFAYVPLRCRELRRTKPSQTRTRSSSALGSGTLISQRKLSQRRPFPPAISFTAEVKYRLSIRGANETRMRDSFTHHPPQSDSFSDSNVLETKL